MKRVQHACELVAAMLPVVAFLSFSIITTTDVSAAKRRDGLIADQGIEKRRGGDNLSGKRAALVENKQVANHANRIDNRAERRQAHRDALANRLPGTRPSAAVENKVALGVGVGLAERHLNRVQNQPEPALHLLKQHAENRVVGPERLNQVQSQVQSRATGADGRVTVGTHELSVAQNQRTTVENKLNAVSIKSGVSEAR